MAVVDLRFVDDGVPGDTLTNLYDNRNGPEAQVQRPEVDTVHRICICM